jgi:hypothetical protein
VWLGTETQSPQNTYGFAAVPFVTVGAMQTGLATFSQHVTGHVCEAALWTVALDAGDAMDTHNAGNPVDLTGKVRRRYDMSSYLRGYWTFQNGMEDLSGYRNDMTGTATYASVFPVSTDTLPFSARSLYLDNTTVLSHDMTTTPSYLLTGGSFTVCAWAKFSETSSDNYLWSYGDNGASNLVGFNCVVGGAWYFYSQGSGAYFAVNTNSTTTDVWYHVTVVVENGTSVRLYRDGVLDSTHSMSLPGSSSDHFFRIGAYKNGGSYVSVMRGYVDEVGLFDTALTDDNVAAVYNGGNPLDLSADSGGYDKSAHLQSYWKFENSLLDDGPSEYDLSVETGTATALFSHDVPAPYRSSTGVLTSSATGGAAEISVDYDVEGTAAFDSHVAAFAQSVDIPDADALRAWFDADSTGFVSRTSLAANTIHSFSGETLTKLFSGDSPSNASEFSVAGVTYDIYWLGIGDTNHFAKIAAVAVSSIPPFETVRSLRLVPNDYAYLSGDVLADNTSTGTVSLWARDTYDGTQDQFLYTSGGHTVSSYGQAINYMNGDVRCRWKTSTQQWEVFFPLPLKRNEWHHLAMTLDGTTLRCYHNGVQVGTATASALASTRNWGDLYIGSPNNVAGSYCYDGMLSNVATWSTALNASNVAAVYNGGVPIRLSADAGNYTQSADLVAWWRFEGDLADSAGANDLTFVGSVEYRADVPSGIDLSTRQSVPFAEDHYLYNTTDPMPDGAERGTWAFWVNWDTVTGHNQYLFSNGGQTSSSYGQAIAMVATGKMEVYWRSNSFAFNWVQTTTTFETNRWYHVAFTCDGTTVSVYVDGKFENSATGGTGHVAGRMYAALHIGMPNNNSDLNAFGLQAKVCDVACWNACLRPATIWTLYNRGSDALDLNTDLGEYQQSNFLRAWYRLNGNLTDSSYAAAGTLTDSNSKGYVLDRPELAPLSLQVMQFPDTNKATIANFDYRVGSTWSLWFKTPNTGEKYLFDTSGEGAAYRRAVYIDNGSIVFYCVSGVNLATGGTYLDDAWHQLTLTFASPNLLNAWIDGVRVVTNNTTHTWTSNATSTLYLGSRHTDIWHLNDGDIDDFAVWDTVLTNNAVEAIYNNGKPFDLTQSRHAYTQTANLVAYWEMNGDGTDSTANDNDLVVSDGIVFDPVSIVTVVPGNYSITFDGSSSYAEATVDVFSDINVLPDFTISMWFKSARTDTANQAFLWDITGGSTLRNFVFFGPGSVLRTFTFSRFDTIQSVGQGLPYCDDEWHHIVYVGYAGSKEVSVYVDGNVIWERQSVGTFRTGSSAKFSIAGRNHPGLGVHYLFDAQYKDVAFWSDALTAAQAQSIYHGGSSIDLTYEYGAYGAVSSLYAYWRMNGNTDDASGNGRTMTTFGTVVYASDVPRTQIDPPKNSLEFNGSGQFVSTTLHDSPFRPSRSYTVSLWFKVTEATNDSTIFCTGVQSVNQMIGLQINSSGKLEQFWYGNDYQTQPGFSLHRWHHVVMVANTDDGGSRLLYLNGVEVTNVIASGSATAASVNTDVIYFGGIIPGNSRNYFPGKIADVSIFDTVFTAPQALEMYNAGIPLDATTHSASANLIAYWKFQTNNLFDVSGNQNHLAGTAVLNTDIPFPNREFVYDNSDGNTRLSIPAFPNVNYYEFTISVWIKYVETDTASRLRSVIHTSWSNSGFHWLVLEGTRMQMSISGRGDWITTLPYNITNRWTHFAYTLKSATMNMYVDGVHVDQRSGYEFVRLDSTMDFLHWDNDRVLRAQLSDLAIHNKELTLAEIQAIASANRATLNLLGLSTASSLERWYRFNGTVVDEVVGDTMTGTSSPVYAAF